MDRHTDTHTHTERQTDIQTDIQTDRQKADEQFQGGPRFPLWGINLLEGTPTLFLAKISRNLHEIFKNFCYKEMSKMVSVDQPPLQTDRQTDRQAYRKLDCCLWWIF